MKCTEKEIAELLPWYLTDTLTNEEEGKVRNHLKECSQCAVDLQRMKWFSAGFETRIKAQHILPEQLVVYAEAKAELPEDSVLSIENHLESCQDCQRELQILEKVNQSLKPMRERFRLDAVKWQLREIFPEFLTRPALAYIVILLLLFPAWQGLQRLTRDKEPRFAQANYELSQVGNRSEEGLQKTIQISAQNEVFSLSFNLPILTNASVRYNAYIRNTEGSSIWRKKDIQSLDEYGTFLLVCQSKFFSEGSYTLTVEEIRAIDGRVQQEFVYPFRIQLE